MSDIGRFWYPQHKQSVLLFIIEGFIAPFGVYMSTYVAKIYDTDVTAVCSQVVQICEKKHMDG